jgi:hypothetical protein
LTMGARLPVEPPAFALQGLDDVPHLHRRPAYGRDVTYGFWRASHRYELAGVDGSNAARANIRANKPVPERRTQLHAVPDGPRDVPPDRPECDGAGRSATTCDGIELLRIRRLGIRVPPSALAQVLVDGLWEPRSAIERLAHPYKNPYSCRDEHVGMSTTHRDTTSAASRSRRGAGFLRERSPRFWEIRVVVGFDPVNGRSSQRSFTSTTTLNTPNGKDVNLSTGGASPAWQSHLRGSADPTSTGASRSPWSRDRD